MPHIATSVHRRKQGIRPHCDSHSRRHLIYFLTDWKPIFLFSLPLNHLTKEFLFVITPHNELIQDHRILGPPLALLPKSDANHHLHHCAVDHLQRSRTSSELNPFSLLWHRQSSEQIHLQNALRGTVGAAVAAASSHRYRGEYTRSHGARRRKLTKTQHRIEE